MAENRLMTLSKAFAVSMIYLCDAMWKRGKATAVINQLLRSGTNIGANVHEAHSASDKSEYISCLQKALKDVNETRYWLDIFCDAKLLAKEDYDRAALQCRRIEKLIVAYISTAIYNTDSVWNPDV